MPKFIGYIYSITNELNGKTYIGKTNDLVRRWKEHYYGKGNTSILNKAFKKYGLDHFIFDIVAQIPFENIEELNNVLKELEVYYISLYNSFKNGYNATAGGDGICFYKHSEKTKKRLKQLQKKKWLNPELRSKMATAALGYHHTEDAKKKITDALLNRDHSIYDKMAEKRRGIKRDHDIIMKGAVKRRKPVLQYDMNGNFIQEFSGATHAGFGNGANITACCHNRLISAYGYIWRFKESEDFPRKIKAPSKWDDFKKAVTQYDSSGNVVSDYDSIASAARATGFSASKICQCLKGTQKTTKGFMWKYKERKEVKYA